MKGKRRRSVLPLPDYTRRKPLAGGRWGYYFTPPSWALKPREGDDRGPCPVGCEALGTDYNAAVKRVEGVTPPSIRFVAHTWPRGACAARAAQRYARLAVRRVPRNARLPEA